MFPLMLVSRLLMLLAIVDVLDATVLFMEENVLAVFRCDSSQVSAIFRPVFSIVLRVLDSTFVQVSRMCFPILSRASLEFPFMCPIWSVTFLFISFHSVSVVCREDRNVSAILSCIPVKSSDTCPRSSVVVPVTFSFIHPHASDIFSFMLVNMEITLSTKEEIPLKRPSIRNLPISFITVDGE